MKKLITSVALAAISSAAFAGSLTTTFITNNGRTAPSPMVFMDWNVVSGITVTSFDVNIFEGGTFGIDVYTRSGTAAGFEQSAAGWSLVSSGTGTVAGQDIPSNVDLTDFSLGAGITGVAVHYRDGAVRYFNGTGSNEFYSNGDLSLTGLSASNSSIAGFDGANVFSPRVWSGTVYYDAVPEPATMTVLGLGAVAFLRRKRKS